MKSQGYLFEKMVRELTKEADALATEAETKNKIDLLVKSNVKCKEIKNEKNNTDGLQKNFKQM